MSRAEWLKDAAERKAHARDALVAAMGSTGKATAGAYSLTRLLSPRASLDQAALKAAHPALVADYMRTSQTESLRVTRRKGE